MAGQPLTSPEGPVVASAATLTALTAIRKQELLPRLYGRVTIAQSNLEQIGDALAAPPPWLDVLPDQPDQTLPQRVADAQPDDAATLRLALALPASLVLIEGPIKERAKLSFIKAEGTLSILVAAYREGWLSAVRPMVKALRALGHEHVLPPQDLLEALWQALDELGE